MPDQRDAQDFIKFLQDQVRRLSTRLDNLEGAEGLGRENYILIQDQKASGVAGGAFNSGAWRTRDLNTEVVDTGNYATLAANQITLSAGTYRVSASAPAWQVDGHTTRLQNITDGTTILVGTSSRAAAADSTVTRSWVVGRFTIAAAKVLELQHRCQASSAGSGFGTFAGLGVNEIYSSIEFWRE